MKGAAGILFVKKNTVLMVGTSYKTHWDIPGGEMEAGETPVETAVRECKEEIGVITIPGRLLTQSTLKLKSGILVAWIFQGDERDVEHFAPDGKEVRYAEWLGPMARAAKTVTAPIFRRRLNDAIEALRNDCTIYTEIDGDLYSRPSIRRPL